MNTEEIQNNDAADNACEEYDVYNDIELEYCIEDIKKLD